MVVLAHKFVVMVFRVFVVCLWKKKVAGCWVEGAAALGIWFGAIAMAKARTMRSIPFGPELIRIPSKVRPIQTRRYGVPKAGVTENQVTKYQMYRRWAI